MNRLLRSVLLATALWLAGSRVGAQQDSPHIVPFDVRNSMAQTTCVRENGKYKAYSIFNDATVEGDSLQLAEIKAHEAEHRRQFMADTTLCRDYIHVTFGHPTKKQINAWWGRLVNMETGAYCAGSKVLIRAGSDRTTVYLEYLNSMTGQFAGHLPDYLIISAWFKECGQLLMSP